MRKIALVSVIIGALGIVVLALDYARLTATTAPAQAQIAFPGYSTARIVQNFEERRRLRTGGDTRQMRDRAHAVLRRAPLNAEAIVDLALIARQQGDEAKSARLLRLAQERNARNRIASRALADIMLRNDAYAGALTQLDLLMRVDLFSRDQYFPAISTLSNTLEGRVALLERISDRPDWARQYLRQEINEARDIDFVEDMVLTYAGPERRDRETIILHEALIRRHLRNGDHARVITWRRRYAEPGEDGNAIHNPYFAPDTAPRPIAWELTENADGVAEIESEGGLFISFSGRRNWTLARQVLTLTPGEDHFLSTAIDDQGEANGNRLEWRVSCYAVRGTLTTVSLAPGESATARFTVPAENCALQEISLHGIAGEYARRMNIRVASVAIRDADAPADEATMRDMR